MVAALMLGDIVLACCCEVAGSEVAGSEVAGISSLPEPVFCLFVSITIGSKCETFPTILTLVRLQMRLEVLTEYRLNISFAQLYPVSRYTYL